MHFQHYTKRCCRACRISDNRLSSVAFESHVCIKIHCLLHSTHGTSQNKELTVTVVTEMTLIVCEL